MPDTRPSLPHTTDALFLTDGGLETYLIFDKGVELPDFASFHLHRSDAGETALRDYFRDYAAIARRHGTGLVLETATWRASADWTSKHGLAAEDAARLNARAVEVLEELRDEFAPVPVVVSGCLGPRGDGYEPGAMMTEAEAEAYHQPQVDTLAAAGVDLISALTMNYVEEAIGITQAVRRAGLPVVISFTVETDGQLPTGQALGAAIMAVDDATGGYPAYFMINCAHPTHFAHVLDASQPWVRRVRGLRANASCRSHAELNESTDLDRGDRVALGESYAELRRRLPHLTVLGGCCGTDHTHVEAIAAACVPSTR